MILFIYVHLGKYQLFILTFPKCSFQNHHDTCPADLLHWGTSALPGFWIYLCGDKIIKWPSQWMLLQQHPWQCWTPAPSPLWVHFQSRNMTTPALLPLSGRRIPTLSPGTSSFPHHRATLRLSEKFILLLILSAFITLCFGAFFFLPDNSKHKRFDLGLEDVLIPHIDSPKEGKHASGQVVIHGQGGHDENRHR